MAATPAADPNMATSHPWHASKQDTPTAVGLLQILRALLNGQSPRDLTHGAETRQPATLILNRLVGDRFHASL